MAEPEISNVLLAKAPVIAWAKSRELRYLYVNQAWLTLTGLTKENVLGRTDHELFEEKYADVFVKNDQEVLRTGQTVHAQEGSPDGKVVAHSTKFPLHDSNGDIFAVGGIAVDITQRYIAEKGLEQSERKFRELIEHSPEAFFLYDVQSARFVDVNENTERMFGLSREQLLTTTLLKLSPPFQPDGVATEEKARHFIERTLAGETPVFDWLHQAGDGELLPCRIWLARVDLPTGPGIRASVLDMREIERMRSKLEKTRAQLDAVQDALPQMIVVYDPKSGAMTHCNRTYQQVQLLQPLWELAAEACQRCNEEDTSHQELQASTTSGAVLTLELDASVFARDASGDPTQLLLVASDVTEQRRRDALLRDTQRLESLGRLAGGVAHDFNNLLTVILGSASLLEAALPNNSNARTDLEALTRAADRARDLTSQLLTFARSHKGPEETVPLDARIRHSLDLLRRLAGEDIQLVEDLQAASANVSMSRGQLEQILVNLVANARDAMEYKGRIVIATAEAADPQLSPSALRRFVELSVSDTGSGMNEETLEKAIDPFFTTKGVGHGTGLGLSTVHGIVRHAGGQIRFSSKLGQGTRVIIHLPISNKDRPPKTVVPTFAEPVVARILLVEDEESVRLVNARGLEKEGHQVVSAADAKQALALLQTGTVVDVVVTDVVMPEMSGFELADRVHEFLPSLPFIFVSGYAETALAERGILRSQVDLLQKPFAPHVLCQHVALAVSQRTTVSSVSGDLGETPS